jgi:hypothetical protein
MFQLSLNGIETAFIDEAKKTELRDSFSEEYNQIICQTES